MTLSINRIVNVQLQQTATTAQRKDFGTVLLLTPEKGGVFKDAKTRFFYADSQEDVEANFGTHSETARASLPFFAQRPRAKQLIIGRWNKQEQVLSASKNKLIGASLNDNLTVFKRVKNGRFRILLGGQYKEITGLNFSEVQSFAEIASAIQEAINQGNSQQYRFIYDEKGQRFIMESESVGHHKPSEIGYVPEETTSDYIGGMLKLEDGQAQIKRGEDGQTIPSETPSEALRMVLERNNSWYGLMVADQLSDGEIEEVALFAQTNVKLYALTVFKPEHLEWEDTNLLKKLYDKKMDHTLAVYDKNDLYASHSALAILLSTNFSAQNGTMTLKFKSLPTISADVVTATEYEKALRLGINIYTYFDDVAMLSEGYTVGKRFADEIVNLDWFTDAVQKEVFSRLHQHPTKLPLTDKGNAQLIDAVMRVCIEAVNNGMASSGLWQGAEFGTLKSGDFLATGYYVWAAPMHTLSVSDKEKRKATPIQVALKLAGAIHSSDVLINFNR